MQMTHVSTNLRQGLRRNLSMHVAVVLTLFVSLSLAGIGVLLKREADVTRHTIGDQLQIIVHLCVPDDVVNHSCQGEVTDAQKQVIAGNIEQEEHGPGAEVKSFYSETKQQAYDKYKALNPGDPSIEGPNPLITVRDMPQTYWITLNNPDKYSDLISLLCPDYPTCDGTTGVEGIQDAKSLVEPIFKVLNFLKYGSLGAAGMLILAAILLVANTIRLAALARRREIEIMRLVGASRIFILLPFLLEALVTAAIGVVLACGSLAAFTEWAVIKGLAANTNALPFIGWSDFWWTALYVAIAGPVLTVVPTLLLTRKYLRV